MVHLWLSPQELETLCEHLGTISDSSEMLRSIHVRLQGLQYPLVYAAYVPVGGVDAPTEGTQERQVIPSQSPPLTIVHGALPSAKRVRSKRHQPPPSSCARGATDRGWMRLNQRRIRITDTISSFITRLSNTSYGDRELAGFQKFIHGGTEAHGFLDDSLDSILCRCQHVDTADKLCGFLSMIHLLQLVCKCTALQIKDDCTVTQVYMRHIRGQAKAPPERTFQHWVYIGSKFGALAAGGEWFQSCLKSLSYPLPCTRHYLFSYFGRSC